MAARWTVSNVPTYSTMQNVVNTYPQAGPEVAIRGRVNDPEIPQGLTKYACATCNVTYLVGYGDVALCPACDARSEVRLVRAKLREACAALDILRSERDKLCVQVDMLDAMKDAANFLDGTDRLYLISCIELRRAHRNLQLLPWVAGDETERHLGFLRKLPDGPWKEHRCTSVGGVAMSASYGLVHRAYGSARAMEMLSLAVPQEETNVG